MTHPAQHRWSIVVAGFGLLLGALTVAGGAEAASPSLSHPATAAANRPSSSDLRIRPLPSPNEFAKTVRNPYLPLIPGTRWIYRGGSAGEERIVVKVLHRTKQIEGITATVVRDTVSANGELIEDTFDWFAQDCRGHVWYLGEATKEYKHGVVVSTEGSWETGVDGARAGIAMLAHPKVGVRYRQEYLEGEAEDIGRVLAGAMKVAGPFGHFRHVVMTKDTTSLDRSIVELKFYAPGIGVVREIDLNPEQGSADLIRMVKP